MSESASEEQGAAAVDARLGPVADIAHVARSATRSGARALRVEVVTSAAGFDSLAAPWERLFAEVGATVFQSFPWLRAWWRHLGERSSSAALHIVVVRCAAGANAAVVGIAPLYLEEARGFGLVRVRRLAFLGRPISDYHDVLARDDGREDIIGAIVEHLIAIRSSYDVAVLDELSDATQTARQLCAALVARGVEVECFANERCPQTPLAHSWQETIATFSGGQRRELRRRQRHLEEKFEVALEVTGRPATIRKDMDDFFALHQKRWTRAGRAGALASPAVQAFHHETALAFAQRGWAYLGFLRIDGRRRAVAYGFLFREVLSIYLTGLDDSPLDGAQGTLRPFSPGKVLAARCMEHAIGLGAHRYDFMRGGEPYKYELGATDVVNRTVCWPGGRSLLAVQRHRAALLSDALLRRGRAEALALRGLVADHGVWSAPCARHVRERMGKAIRDGRQKLRDPGRSLTAPPRAAEEQTRV